MSVLFKIDVQKYTAKKSKKLLKKNPSLQKDMDKTVTKLEQNPFDPTISTHKVNSKRFGEKYSSTITGDLRFIWDFNELELKITIIEIFNIGGHKGSKGVY